MISTASRAARAGFVYGAIVYGGGIAVAHLVHNTVDRVGDALVVLSTLMALYGAAAAVVFAACGLIAAVARTLSARRRDAAAEGRASSRVVLAGVTVFNLLFWVPFATYGLTYDQVPFGVRAGLAGMIAVLLARTS